MMVEGEGDFFLKRKKKERSKKERVKAKKPAKKKVMSLFGFEPKTFCVLSRHSNQLS